MSGPPNEDMVSAWVVFFTAAISFNRYNRSSPSQDFVLKIFFCRACKFSSLASLLRPGVKLLSCCGIRPLPTPLLLSFWTRAHPSFPGEFSLTFDGVSDPPSLFSHQGNGQGPSAPRGTESPPFFNIYLERPCSPPESVEAGFPSLFYISKKRIFQYELVSVRRP